MSPCLGRGCKKDQCCTEVTTTTTPPPIVDSVIVGAGNITDMCADYAVGFRSEFAFSKTKATIRGQSDGLGMTGGWQLYDCIIMMNDRCVNLKITNAVGSTYVTRNANRQGKAFNDRYNGEMEDGIVSVGSEATGSFKFDFTFTFKDDNTAAVLPYLPLTFYDLDGKPLRSGKSYEVAKTCEAEGVVVDKTTMISKSYMDTAGCAVVEGGKQEVPIPKDWTHLASLQKRAAATFGFKGLSKFSMEYTLNFRHRVFVMKGNRAMACVD